MGCIQIPCFQKTYVYNESWYSMHFKGIAKQKRGILVSVHCHLLSSAPKCVKLWVEFLLNAGNFCCDGLGQVNIFLLLTWRKPLSLSLVPLIKQFKIYIYNFLINLNTVDFSTHTGVQRNITKPPGTWDEQKRN